MMTKYAHLDVWQRSAITGDDRDMGSDYNGRCVYLFPRKYSPLHDDEWDVQVSGGEDQSLMAEVNIFLENFHPP